MNSDMKFLISGWNIEFVKKKKGEKVLLKKKRGKTES